MTTSATNRSGFDDTHRIVCVVRTVVALKRERKLIAKCFEKCGLLTGNVDISRHFPPSAFNAVVPMRDLLLPQVNIAYVKAVLSLANLASAPGMPVRIPTEVISEQQQLLAAYRESHSGFRKFYFSLGSTATVDSVEDESSTTSVRKLFRLGKAVNIPRGVPGRVSTAYGAVLSAKNQYERAVVAEKNALENLSAKTAREKLRESNERLA